MNNSFQYRLGDNLVLRIANSDADVVRVASNINQPNQPQELYPDLILHHPDTRFEDLFFVEDEDSGQVVSYLSWIPRTWRIAGVDIPSAEIISNVTLKPYRHRGLVRKQMDLYKQRLDERGCLLSQINGIPYFYRQFGYEYALPLEGGCQLDSNLIPDFSDKSFSFRPATHDDIFYLGQLYSSASKDLSIYSVRSSAIWNYLLTYSNGRIIDREFWLIRNELNHVVGYFCVMQRPFQEALLVSEISYLDFDLAMATIDFLKSLAKERNEDAIQFNLPDDTTLMQVARWLGAKDNGIYPWQIFIPDLTALLKALAPALEQRIADSNLAKLTREVRICLFRKTIVLRFDSGQLVDVANIGFTNWEDEPVLCPPLSFVPLVLGYRTAKELQSMYPDITIRQDHQQLINTLFPKMTSFIYTIY
jgi:hypothetical protein